MPAEVFRKLFTRADCEAMGALWANSPSNFDNVAEAMVLLFETR
jgi:hypothetical protein